MRRHDNAGPGHWSLLLIHFATAFLAVVDFILFHIAAAGLAIAIYLGIPLLDDAIGNNAANWTWLGIFRIVGPTVTLPGGAVTVLSTYFYARRIQEIEKEKQAAEKGRQEEARLRQEAEKGRQEEAHLRQEEARLRQEAEAQVEILKAQLEQTTARPHRQRRRRRLRNGASREAQ